ncbi:hypothetical protein JM79_2129 [Gramella sp. Hel_I_59]|nr:hypothetical protein JM79_2129 [Gramella sp. Hel_I_59]
MLYFMRDSNLLFLLFFLPIINSFAQNESNFDHFVMSEIGKINNDKTLDSVAVTQDTINEKRPYRLEIFFGEDDKNKKLVLMTEKAILPDFPSGRNVSDGEEFWEIEIIDRNLWIKHELLRGHFEHNFQYRDGKFKLMEYNSVASDGRGKIFYQNLDFLTGIRRTQTDSYEQDKVLKKEEEFIKIEGKPDLSNFEPKSNRFY